MIRNIKIVIYQALFSAIIPILNIVLLKFFGEEVQVYFFEKKLFLDMLSTIFCLNIIVLPIIMLRNKFKPFRDNFYLHYVSQAILIIFIGSIFIHYFSDKASFFDAIYILGMFTSHSVAGAILFAEGLTLKHITFVSLPTLLLPLAILFFTVEFSFGVSGIVSSIISLYFLSHLFRFRRFSFYPKLKDIFKIFKLNFIPWLYSLFQAFSVYFAYEFLTINLDLASRSNLSLLIILQTVIIFPILTLTPQFFREHRSGDPIYNLSLIVIILMIVTSIFITEYAFFLCATLLLSVARVETARSLADNKIRSIYILTRYGCYLFAMFSAFLFNNFDLAVSYFGFFCIFEVIHRIALKVYFKCSTQ